MANVGHSSPPQRAAHEIGTSTLRRLLTAASVLGVSPEVAKRLFDSLTVPWLNAHGSYAQDWHSDVSDDGSPLELSVSLKERPELRLLVEAQGQQMGGRGSFEAGKVVNAHLAQNFDANLDRFHEIEDLFCPDGQVPVRFSMWHAAVALASGELAFKLYLNPLVRGVDRGVALVKEALHRLKLSHALELVGQLEESYRGSLECLYFSLDIDHAQGSRVKIYFPHRNATLSSMERELAPLAGNVRWDARQTFRTLVGTGPLLARPALSCLGFREGESRPQHTMHIPVRCYCAHDEDVIRRLDDLAPYPISEQARAVASATAERPLRADSGHITYVSVKRNERDVSVTLYLSSGDVPGGDEDDSVSRARIRAIPEPAYI